MLEWTRDALNQAAGIELEPRPDRLPWFLQLMAGIIAWVAATFGMCFSALCMADLEALWAPLGVVIALVSAFVARGAGGFPDLVAVGLGQLGLIGSVIARLLLGIGVYEIVKDFQGTMALLALVELGFIALFPQGIQRTYSAVAIPLMLLGAAEFDPLPRELLAGLATVGALVGFWLLPRIEPVLVRLDPGRHVGVDTRTVSNLVAPVCYGMTLFVLGLEGVRFVDRGRVDQILGLVYAVVAIGVVVALIRRHRLGGIELFAAAFGGALMLPMGWFVPALPLAVALLLVGVERRHSILCGLAVIGSFIYGGLLYYELQLSLFTKGAVLIGSGVFALMLRRLVQQTSGQAVAGRSPASVAGAALALSLTLGVVGGQVGRAELIVRNGQRVYLELAPVDPRSLVQGDYMRLAYALDRQARDLGEGWAVAEVDERGVITGLRASPSSNDAVRLWLTETEWRASPIATNAYLFQEGTAKVWEEAEYGEFRLSGGKLVLVGLADADLRPLGTPRPKW